TVTPGATIAKDSHIGGGNVYFGGTEGGNLIIAGGTVTIDGTINGNVKISKAQTVVIKSTAVIKKNFEYSAAAPATIEAGAKVLGATTYHTIGASAAENGRDNT